MTDASVQVKLSQDDLKVVLRILMENLGEAGSPEPAAAQQETSLQVRATGATPTGPIEFMFRSSLIQS